MLFLLLSLSRSSYWASNSGKIPLILPPRPQIIDDEPEEEVPVELIFDEDEDLEYAEPVFEYYDEEFDPDYEYENGVEAQMAPIPIPVKVPGTIIEIGGKYYKIKAVVKDKANLAKAMSTAALIV